MRYFKTLYSSPFGEEIIITKQLSDNHFESFIWENGNPNVPALEQWLAEGNTLEEWPTGGDN